MSNTSNFGSVSNGLERLAATSGCLSSETKLDEGGGCFRREISFLSVVSRGYIEILLD